MVIVKRVKMLVPSELLYVFDPDAEDYFVINRERGRLIARPISEQGILHECAGKHFGARHSHGMANMHQMCVGCPCYDDLRDRCRHEANCMEDE